MANRYPLVLNGTGIQELQAADGLSITSLTSVGTGNRIYGDFSNATETNRLSFATTTTNGNTIVPLYPNGSGTLVGFSAPTVPMTISVNGSERFRFGTSGQLGIAGANFGTSGQVMISGGASAAPSWSTDIAGNAGNVTGIVAVLNGGTGTSTAAQAKINLNMITGATGSAVLPAGTTAQRDVSPAAGYFRYNTSNAAFEGYNGSAWAGVGGASGGGGNPFIYENDIHVTANYSLTTGKNGGSFGPVTIDNGVTVTVPSGSVWSIV